MAIPNAYMRVALLVLLGAVLYTYTREKYFLPLPTLLLRVKIALKSLFSFPDNMTSSPQTSPAILTDFALNLYRQIAAESSANAESKNIFISPMSISYALAMTYAGAAGNTKEQMKKVLFGGERLAVVDKDEDVHSMFAHVMGVMNKQGSAYKLHLANRVYANESAIGGQLLAPFSNTLKEKYESELEPVDFGKDGGNFAAGLINAWVSERTNQKIKDLIAPGSLNDLTAMVLVNAIYFKGDWKTKFNAGDTRKRPFFASPNKEIQLELMHLYKQKVHYYDENPDYRVLGLPYTGNDLFMFIWLPREGHGLAELEKSLSAKDLLDSITGARENTKLAVIAIPKFKLEESIDLGNTLKTLGASDMFDQETADFSNINGHKGLSVSAVIHKAFVEVNEEGTEAAAATAVHVMKRCAETDPYFIADHPFMFGIVDIRTTSILFFGRYCGE